MSMIESYRDLIPHLLERLGACVMMTDADSVILYSNPAFSDLYGYTQEELIGAKPSLLSSGLQSQALYAYMWQVLNSGKSWRGEVLNRHKDGSLRCVDLTITPVSDPASGKQFYVSVSIDITEQKAKLENEGRVSRALKSAIDAIEEAFVVFDTDDRLLICNDRYRNLYQTSKDLIVPGAFFEDIIREGALRGQYEEAVGREEAWVSERLKNHRHGNTSLIQKIDHGHWVRVVERKTPDGMIVGFRFDVTELMEAKQAAEASNNAKGGFLAKMSHEIRTPMNAIIGLSDLALHDEAMPLELRDLIQKINSAGNSLLGIVNDILDFSKIEAGKLSVEEIPLNLWDVVADVHNLLIEKANEKGLIFHSALFNDVPTRLLGDPLRLTQVLTNLLSNAIKFTEEGSVFLTVTEEAPQEGGVLLCFTVTDTGIGMNAGVIERLFNPFEQADVSITRKYGGTGLGLSICKQLIELMGGRLEVRSELGRGSVFRFQIKLKQDVQTQAELSQTQTPRMQQTALIVIDDDLTRGLVRRVLREHGVNVLIMRSADEALNAVQLKPETYFRLVMIERRMSGQDCMDGLELAQKLRLLPATASSPVIMLTDAELDGILSYETQGVYKTLFKPVYRPALTKVIDEILGIPLVSSERKQRFPHLNPGFLRGARILLVEDNAINQVVAKGLLSVLGAQVTLADHGQAALDILDTQTFDIVLMDLQMPVMDGISATRAILAQPRFAHMPILAMTAHALSEERDHCLAAGMLDVITKPLSSKTLHQVLGRYWLLETDSDLDTRGGTDRPESFPSERMRDAEDFPWEDLKTGFISCSDGLQYSAGNPAVYLDTLKSFEQKLQGIRSEIRDALENQCHEDARAASHVLHGMSGAVGCLRLQKAAGILELALKQKPAVPLANLPAYLEEEIEFALSDLQKIFAHPALTDLRLTEKWPEEMVDREKLQMLLSAFQEKLEKNMLSARDLCLEIEELLRPTSLSKSFQPTFLATRKLDFSSALMALSAFLPLLLKKKVST